MNRAQRGLFVTFEGGDGAGKTTQLLAVDALLTAAGMSTLMSREPAGTEIGEQIRANVMRSGGYIDPQAEALLFAADRAQNINTHVAPALDRGVHVLQERFLDTSYAYAAAGQILNPREVWDLGLWASSGLVPDLTVLLDCTAETLLIRGGVPAGFDADEADGYVGNLRQEFLNLARRNPLRYLTIEGERPVEEITNLVLKEIEERL